PLGRARMRAARRERKLETQRRTAAFLAANASFRRYVLRELEQRGPLLSLELEDRSPTARRDHRWSGNRSVGVLLEIMHRRGEVAVAGRRQGQRLWDLAQRWYPETETVSLREAERAIADKRFRALGVRLEGGAW